jgi:2-oxoglutaroyl-CoA hydrolase
MTSHLPMALQHPDAALLEKPDGFSIHLDLAHERADIVLGRPPFNVILMPQRDQLRAAFEALDAHPGVRVIVLRAEGEHFSSGGDIKGFLAASPEHVSDLAWNVAAPARCSKPVIAAVRGYCFGVGFELSLACDFRIASTKASFLLPENQLGVLPASGACSRMIQMIGMGRLKEMVMAALPVQADEAHRIGLVNRVYPPEELMDQTLAFARMLKERAPLAMGMAKHIINTCQNVDTETGRILERLGQSILIQTEDNKEGMRAFMEKRKPDFRGR